MSRRVLVVRQDSMGDVLLAGPAVGALADRSRPVVRPNLDGRAERGAMQV